MAIWIEYRKHPPFIQWISLGTHFLASKSLDLPQYHHFLRDLLHVHRRFHRHSQHSRSQLGFPPPSERLERIPAKSLGEAGSTCQCQLQTFYLDPNSRYKNLDAHAQIYIYIYIFVYLFIYIYIYIHMLYGITPKSKLSAICFSTSHPPRHVMPPALVGYSTVSMGWMIWKPSPTLDHLAMPAESARRISPTSKKL